MTDYKYRKVFVFNEKGYDVRANSESELYEKWAIKLRYLEEAAEPYSKSAIFSLWVKEWLSVYKKPVMSLDEYDNLMSMLKNHILPAFGGMKIYTIKPIHLQKLLNDLALKDYSYSFISKIKFKLNDIFDNAVGNEIVSKNPMDRVKLPKCKNGTNRAMTNYEKEIFLQACKINKYGVWALCMYYLGCRPAEVSRIKIYHIDLENERIFIDGTKTKKAKRTLPIPKVFINTLAIAMIDKEKNDYLFKNRTGSPVNKTNVRRMWQSIKKDMHILMDGKTDYGSLNRIVGEIKVAKDLRPYCLRHTFCTNLQDANVPINIAKELMGHSNINMTANIYTHTSDEAISKAQDLINNYH